MRKMKNESGITMLILVVTIIVLTIITSIVIHYGINGVDYSEEKKQLANLEAVQQAVYQQYEQYKITEDTGFIIGDEVNISEYPLEDNEWIIKSPSSEVERYYKLTKEKLKELGIKEEKDEYIVNYKTGECFNLTKKRTAENNHELYIK